MGRWIRYPTIERMQVTIGFVACIALIGIALSVLSLRSSAETAARREADTARQEAVIESQCAIIEINLVKPGDPQPTTARGRDLAAKYQAEWERLECR